MAYLSRGGRAYHYLTAGEGERPGENPRNTVVLLHAFPLTAQSFAPQLSAVPKGVRLLVPDHAGFGQSAPAEGGFTFETAVGDVLALLDDLKIERALVGGVSMGGYLALALLRADASRVKGLILSDTQATADDEAGKARREATATDVETKGLQGLAKTLIPSLLGPQAPESLRQQLEAVVRAQRPASVAAAARAMGARSDGRDLLHRFSGPSLIVVGEHDAVTPLPKARQMHELLVGSSLVTIDGAGHLPQLEQPEAFNRALFEFCALAG